MKKKVLIVEDEPILAIMYRKGLEGGGYEVSGVVSSGEDAVSEAGRLLPDIIVMDIILSGAMDGVEAAELIGRNFGIPCVYVTGNNDQMTKSRAMKTEPVDYLVKPVNMSYLCEIIYISLS